MGHWTCDKQEAETPSQGAFVPYDQSLSNPPFFLEPPPLKEVQPQKGGVWEWQRSKRSSRQRIPIGLARTPLQRLTVEGEGAAPPLFPPPAPFPPSTGEPKNGPNNNKPTTPSDATPTRLLSNRGHNTEVTPTRRSEKGVIIMGRAVPKSQP